MLKCVCRSQLTAWMDDPGWGESESTSVQTLFANNLNFSTLSPGSLVGFYIFHFAVGGFFPTVPLVSCLSTYIRMNITSPHMHSPTIIFPTVIADTDLAETGTVGCPWLL